RVERALRLPGRLPRPLLREAPLQLRPARARGAADVPGTRARRRRAGRGAGASLREDACDRLGKSRFPAPLALSRALRGRSSRSSSATRIEGPRAWLLRETD